MTDYYDYCELAGKILKLDDEAIEEAIEDGNIEQLFEEETERTIEELQEIGDMLMQFTIPVKSGLSEKMMQGYADVARSCFIVKREFLA